MNNKVVIAGLIGAAAAADATPCDDAFTAEAESALSALEITKEGLEFATDALVASAAAEATLFTTASTRAGDQTTLMAPFALALTDAAADYETKSAALTAANTAIAALATPITAAGTAKAASQAIVDAQQALIDAQQIVVDNMAAAMTEHTTERTAMQTLLDTATTELTTATAAITTATTSRTTLVTERDTATTGQAAKSTDADTAAGLTDTAATTAATNLTNDSAYQPAKLAFDKQVKLIALYTTACTFNDGSAKDCTTYTNCPIKTILDTATTLKTGSLTSTLTPLSSTWTGLVTASATAEDNKSQNAAAKTVANANLATINSAITTLETSYAVTDGATPCVVCDGALTTTKNTKTTAKATAQTNYDTVNGQLTQATTDHSRGALLLDTLKENMVPLMNDLTVKTYLETVQTDLLAVQNTAKAAATAGLTELNTLKGMAQDTVDRATATMDFYTELLTAATASKTAADTAVTDNANAITAIDLAIVGGAAEVAAAIAECKGRGYEKAQAALKALMDAEEGRRIASANVKVDYEAKAAFATGGETNTLCAYPPKAKDAAQEPRPVCKEGFCCGAAQKFLKDGTKLAIETCQKAEGVHTYTFFPPLPEGATIEPTPETWRFQCISGAQKLIATATAALAASYMMA